MKTLEATTHRNWELIGAFAFGVVFIIVILVVAFLRPNPSPFEYTVFRIVLALAAAGVGAILPGFLHVTFRNWLRAGGALALFVIVYFFAPVAMPQEYSEPVVAPSGNGKIEVDRWLALVDQQVYTDAYSSMADAFRQRYSYDQFEIGVKKERQKLGAVKSRELVSSSSLESPPGYAKGAYMIYLFKTLYEGAQQPIYEQISLSGRESAWRVLGFYYTVKSASGQFVPYEP